jgi:SNF2 family DNA or RNA helicase
MIPNKGKKKLNVKINNDIFALGDYSFRKIYQEKILLHKPIHDCDIRIVGGGYKRLFIFDMQEFQYNSSCSKTIYNENTVRFKYYHFKNCLIYPYLNEKTEYEMKNETSLFIRHNNHLLTSDLEIVTVIVCLKKQDDDYFVAYYANSQILNDIQNNKTLKNRSLIYDLILKDKLDEWKHDNNENLEFLKSQSYDDKNDIDKFHKYFCISDNLKEDVELFIYQQLDMLWMKNLEKKSTENNSIYYNFNTVTDIWDGDIVIYNNDFLPRQSLNNIQTNFVKQIDFRGGNLISEVGLGKTLTCIAYCLLDSELLNQKRISDQFVETGDLCNHVYKRGENKGIRCKNIVSDLSNDIYCNYHKKNIFREKLVLSYRNLHLFDINKYCVSGYLKTNATLIISPNQVCDQWVNEYYKYFRNKFRVIMIATYEHFDNLVLGDLLFADLVIVSNNFLCNESYKNYVRNSESNNYCNSDNEQILNSKNSIYLHNFRWNRVILDEAHEIQNLVKYNEIRNYLRNIKSVYWWNVTGTPFSNGLSGFFELMSYNTDLIETFNVTSDEYKNIDNLSIYKMINLGLNSDLIKRCKKLFRCNTRDSVMNNLKEKNFNDIKINENLKLLEFTLQERNIYESYKHTSVNDLVKLCCHPTLDNKIKNILGNCKTFDEIQNQIYMYNKNLIQDYKTKILNVENVLDNLNNINDEQLSNQEMSDLSKSYKIQLTQLRNKLESTEKTFTYLQNTIDNKLRFISDKNTDNITEEVCAICLDSIERKDTSITACGHIFCWNCLNYLQKMCSDNNNNFKCPTCKTELDNTKYYLLKTSDDSNYDKSRLIETLQSTKLGNIVYFLKNLNATDKVIVFSQWDLLLKKVGDILQKYKVNFTYCSGNIYKRNKSIKSFINDDSVQVIMLSSKNYASGINLTIANKIIFIEPVYGDTEYRRNIENQAIGRAKRIGRSDDLDIYRFIIQDTVEHEIYRGNFSGVNKLCI